MTKDEERELILRAQAGDESAREQLVLDHWVNVKRMALHYAPRGRKFGLELDDLIGFGSIGLVRAINTFDVNRGVMFSTHAFKWIRGRIARSLRDNTWPIRLPHYLYDKGCEDKHPEMVALAKKIRAMSRRTLMNNHALDEGASPLKQLLKAEAIDMVRQVVSELPSRESQTISHTFALDDKPKYTPTQIAEIDGVSRQAIHWRINRAKERLAYRLRELGETG